MASTKEFINDGLTNEAIIKSVYDVIMKNKECKDMNVDEKYEKLKLEFDFFATRYPMLFDLALRDEPFNWDNLNYMLNMRNNIIEDKMTSENASKVVGKEWFDKYVDTSTMTKTKKQKK
jgi:hypothetical protein